MSSCLRRYSVRHELNTLDACWIAVDVWSNSSRCRKYRSTCLGRDAYMYDHCLRYRHDFARFYQLLDSNLFTHRLLAFMREATSKHYGPGSIHIHRLHFRFYFALLLCCFQFSLGKQSIRDWQPLHSVGCKLLCLCRILRYSSAGLIHWFSNWGKYLSTLCYITLSASREHQRKAPRPQGKSFAYLPRKSLKA